VNGARAAGDGRAAKAALVVVAGLTCLVFFDLVFRGHVLFERDIHALFWGQCESFVNVLVGGAWPVWDPYLGFGQAMLANPGAQVFYPLTWLNLLMRPESYYSVYAVGHLLLAGSGMLLLGRACRFSWAGSTTAAAVWMLSGPLLSAVDLWQHFAGAAWMPWVIVGAERALARPSARRVVAWALLQTAQVLTGSLDLVVLTALPQAALVLNRVNWRRPLGRATGRLVGRVALAAGLTVLWTAALWLPALALLGQTGRADLPETGRMLWSVPPVGLLQCLLPVLPESLPLRFELRRLLFDGREPLLSSIYLGLPAFALVLSAAVSTRRRLVGAAAALVVLSLMLALGRHGLAYFIATGAVPQLELLRYPVKTTLLAALGFALLAGAGLDAWRQGRLSRRTSTVVAGVVALGGLLALLAARWLDLSAYELLDPGPRNPLVPGAVEAVLVLPVWSGIVALVVAALVALASRAEPRRVVALSTVVAALAALDLLVVHRGINPTVPRAFAQATPSVVAVLHEDAARRIHAFDYLQRPKGATSLRPTQDPELLQIPQVRRHLVVTRAYPTSLTRFGLRGSFDVDVVGLHSRGRRGLRLLILAAQRNPAQLLRLLRLGGVSHVLALHQEGLEGFSPRASFEAPLVGAIHVFRVPDSLPTVSVVAGVRVADGLDAYKALVAPDFDPRTSVVLASGEPREAPAGFSRSAELQEQRADRLRARVSASAPAHVVLPESFDEGWTATVEGHPVPVLRVNVSFRAVAVPAGTHDVTLVYRPARLRLGLGLSGLSIAATLAVLGLLHRRIDGAPRNGGAPQSGGTRDEGATP